MQTNKTHIFSLFFIDLALILRVETYQEKQVTNIIQSIAYILIKGKISPIKQQAFYLS